MYVGIGLKDDGELVVTGEREEGRLVVRMTEGCGDNNDWLDDT